MPSGTKAGKEAKRRVVAKGIVAGKAHKEIAREAGCKTRHVSRLAEEPETQFLIAEMLKPHRKKLERLAGKCILAIEKALDAKTTDKADHMTRMRAVGRTKEMLEMAQGRKTEELPESKVELTWEQFKELYETQQAKGKKAA